MSGIHRHHGAGPEPEFYVNFLRVEEGAMHLTLVARGGTAITTRVVSLEEQEKVGSDPVWQNIMTSGTPENVCAYLFPVEYSRVRRRVS